METKMRNSCIVIALMVSASASAGGGLEEADYLEMADLVIDGAITTSNCLDKAETDEMFNTDFSATVSVAEVLKGEEAAAELTILSTVIEYKEEGPACGENGRVHPAGERARYYLEATAEAGVYRDIDQFSTYAAEDSAPEEAPTCEEDPGDEPGDENGARACAVGLAVPGLALWLPLVGLAMRRRRA
jgi:hypothetical protein